MIDENGLARQIRDVAVEDLLGRTPVHLEQDRISAKLRGRVVLVTGAAGSIGSEMCRQIARFEPQAIVGFEIAESPLFNLQLEMARTLSGTCVPRGDRQHSERGAAARRCSSGTGPSAVYHAAAYKHVPLMEVACLRGGGEQRLRDAERGGGGAGARGDGVRDDFVGQGGAAGQRDGRDQADGGDAGAVAAAGEGRYVSVRFGNVLGSNGSVVPIFKEQIARGRAGDGDASGDAPVFHDDSGGVPTGAAGVDDGQGRRDLRAGYGRAGAGLWIWRGT